MVFQTKVWTVVYNAQIYCAMKFYIRICNLFTGQSFLTLPELLANDGFPVPPLQPNSSTPANTTFQWVFPGLSFKAGLNITGWLFQADSTSDLDGFVSGLDDKDLIFTLWDRFDDDQSSDMEVFTTFTRCELNSTRASSVQKITGISPSLYYYKLEEALETGDGSAFGICGTNETLQIRFMSINISLESAGWRMEGDDNTFTCSNIPNPLSPKQATSFPYMPLVTPVLGE